jgi:hypothetical protein
LDAVVEVEFGEDAGDVVVDGVGAEQELSWSASGLEWPRMGWCIRSVGGGP